MTRSFIACLTATIITIAATTALTPLPSAAAPTAEVAKKCLKYGYIQYPYKRPGAAPGSGDRQAYIKDCIAKNGEVATPTASMPAAPKTTPAAPKPN